MCSTIDILLSADYRTKRYEDNFSTACMWSYVDFWSKSHEILFLSVYSGGEYSKWDYITSAHWKEEVEIFNKSLIDRFENDVDLSFLMMIFTVNFGSWLHKATDVSMMWSSFRVLGDKILVRGW